MRQSDGVGPREVGVWLKMTVAQDFVCA